jgi:nucleotide-binding universal stress UspA family protein
MLDLAPGMPPPDRWQAEEYLTRVAARLPEPAAVRQTVARGNVVQELLRRAEDPDVVLTLSTRGRGGLGRALLGSVADKVMRLSSAPVALARDSFGAADEPLWRIVVPLDGSPLAEEALPYAAELAQRGGSTLELVRVATPFWQTSYAPYATMSGSIGGEAIQEIDEALVAQAQAYLDGVATTWRGRGLTVLTTVRLGRHAEEIANLAEASRADLIVLATHGRGGARRVALGSVASELTHIGTTPLLVIPPRAGVWSSDEDARRVPACA